MCDEFGTVYVVEFRNAFECLTRCVEARFATRSTPRPAWCSPVAHLLCNERKVTTGDPAPAGIGAHRCSDLPGDHAVRDSATVRACGWMQLLLSECSNRP